MKKRSSRKVNKIIGHRGNVIIMKSRSVGATTISAMQSLRNYMWDRSPVELLDEKKDKEELEKTKTLSKGHHLK